MKLPNQKAKVPFFYFFYFFDRNQPMTQPSAGKNRPGGEVVRVSFSIALGSRFEPRSVNGLMYKLIIRKG